MFCVSACDVRQLPSSSNSDHNKTVNTSRKKKHQRLTDEGGDVQEKTVLVRAKRGRKRKSISEAGLDNSSFIALVTASNLKADTLYLPKDCTSSNGLPKKYGKIVLNDGRGNSWELDMRYNKSSDSFYITRGWKHLCDENGKKAGSVFTFELMKKGGTPFLSFSPTKSTLCYETSEDQDKFVTLNVSYDSLKNRRLYLPTEIMIKNGLDESRLVTLLGKDGTRTIANLTRETAGRNFGRLSLGKAWWEFAVANRLKVDEHFTLECIWVNATPILKLSDTKPQRAIKRGRKRKISEASKIVYVSTESMDGKKHEKGKNLEQPIHATSLIEKRLVVLQLFPQEVKACMLLLPSQFLKANGINKTGKIVLLGKNEFESWCGYLLSRDGILSVGCGWRNFCESNGVKIGDSFSLEFMHKDDNTPVEGRCLFARNEPSS